MKGIVIVGTDTNVGKTMLSSLLMASDKRWSYWKPIQSGLQDETDTQTVQRLSGASNERILPEAYRLQQPLSPHLSARLDGVTIEQEKLALPTQEDLLVETAGGVLVPLHESLLQIDQLVHWKLPVLIATRSSLGTINHSLLTIEALRAREIKIIGAVMIGEPNPENEHAVTTYGNTTIVGRIPMLSDITAQTLRNVYHSEFEA